MLALRLCSLLLLWVWVCPAQETDADDAAEIFEQLYIDYPPRTDLQLDQYCNHMMKERELTDRKSNTFIRAPYEMIEDACNSDEEDPTGLHFIGQNVTATMCAATTSLADGYYGDYCIRFLVPDALVYCKDGVPSHPYNPAVGFFD